MRRLSSIHYELQLWYAPWKSRCTSKLQFRQNNDVYSQTLTMPIVTCGDQVGKSWGTVIERRADDIRTNTDHGDWGAPVAVLEVTDARIAANIIEVKSLLSMITLPLKESPGMGWVITSNCFSWNTVCMCRISRLYRAKAILTHQIFWHLTAWWGNKQQ